MFGKGKAVAVQAADTGISIDKKPADDLGQYPANVDNAPGQSKSQERALRAVSLVAFVSGMMNIALIMLIITLFPLQKVFPYLVTFKSQNNQVVAIEPMDTNAPGMLYATEDAVRDYVVQRHSFVPIEAVMTAQWGANSRLAARTSPDLYGKFAAATTNETKRMMEAGYTRTIDINSVQRIAADTWQVNFTTHDAVPTNGGTLTGATVATENGSGFGQNPGATTAPPTAPIDQTWVATMRVDYEPQNVTYDKRLVNPLGFTVTDYSVSRTTGN